MRSKSFYFFLFLLFIAFVINIGTLVLIHEEPRRGIIAFEMIKSSNFLQPTVLGEPYYKKPPFHNWILVLFSLLFGKVSEVSLRLPSALSVVLTSLIIYLLGKEVVGRERAKFAALIFPTFFVVLIGYGTKCEPDTLFTLLCGASYLTWLYFYQKGKRLIAWGLGYFFTALALLTKGLPAVQFFLVFTFSYLFVKGKLKEFLTKEHFIGLLIGLIPFTAWLLSVKTEVAVKTLLGEVISRAPGEVPLTKSLKRYVTYPFRLVASTFPWSLIFLYYYARERKFYLEPTQKALLLAFSLDALTYWLFPGSRLRYLMPALPLLSLFLGSYLYDKEVIHKRAIELLRFSAELIVPLGIVAGVIITKDAHLILKETVIFITFLYATLFLLAPKLDIRKVVILSALLMLILRGFYSSYYYPIAEFKYPPVRKVGREIAKDSKGFKLYTKTKYLQLCFYVERDRNEILRFTKNPPSDSLFLSQRREGFVLKEYKLGRHEFFLCSYGLKSLSPEREGGEGQKKQTRGRQNHSKEREESLQG
ncbi:ArnT family glycosyltransferase [Thermovibrio sp.]